jgi:hypothetical protein
VPLILPLYRRDLKSTFLSSFYLEDDKRLFPFNISNIDWYLISSADSDMSLISPPSSLSSFNLINLLNSTATPSTTIRPMALIKALPVALVLSSIVVLCICGNILVILSVFTFRPLRTVQNFFIVSLAFSDMLVAIIVMPFHIVTHILKRWIFGKKIKEDKQKNTIYFCFFRTNFLSSFCHVRCSSMYFIDIKSLCYSSKIVFT